MRQPMGNWSERALATHGQLFCGTSVSAVWRRCGLRSESPVSIRMQRDARPRTTQSSPTSMARAKCLTTSENTGDGYVRVVGMLNPKARDSFAPNSGYDAMQSSLGVGPLSLGPIDQLPLGVRQVSRFNK